MHRILLLASLLSTACTAEKLTPRAASAPTPPANAPVQALAHIPSAPGSDYPFSPGVKAGGMLYLSGQLGTDSTGKLVRGGVQAETRQAIANIRALLEANGSSLAKVVKCTAMLADIKEWPAMNEVYTAEFPKPYPARSAFAGSGLALGARVELECMAVAE
ncbi:MAG: Rid family hydrolase [Gemmatimonadales bacterium]|nr:Rid family hydrolase [Gemmatimonadales bacterium]